MAELDRVVWAGGLAFASYGARMGIRVEDPALLDGLRACLPPQWRPMASPVVEHLYSLRVDGAGVGSGTAPAHTLYAGPWPVSRTRDPQGALDSLRGHLEALVAVIARRWLFVHAGVVGWRGRAVVIPGRSGSGKTTLVATLVRAGATYYSDEYAVLDEQGRVHPYPRPLRLRTPGGAPGTDLTAGGLAGRPGRRSLRVGLVAVTAYRPRARWRPRALSPGEALLVLLDNTVVARDPDRALPVLRRAVGAARAIRSRRAEADEVVASLLVSPDPRRPAPGRSEEAR